MKMLGVEERLARLERSLRRCRLVATAACVGLAAVVLVAADSPDVWSLQKPIVIRDRAGTDRIWLGLEDDEPRLRFYDAKHSERVDLYVTKGNGNVGLSLRNRDDGEGFLPKVVEARLSMSAEGNGSLMVQRADGKDAYYPARQAQTLRPRR